jgi:ketol-acid reductoisomerase
MARIFYDDDASLALLHGRRILVAGYGNQGRAHALNLRDSGCDVRVGLYQGSRSWQRAQSEGFAVQTVVEAAQWADIIGFLLPDQQHKQVFELSIGPFLAPGKLLLVAHGFSIHFGQIVPPPEVDVGLVAPVGPGALLRQLFLEGKGIPAAIAVHRDTSGCAERLVLAYAKALGCTRAGAIHTTLREETESDLFGEQVVLCGGIPALIMTAFRTLLAAGYQPEVAYFECVHQVKLIVDLIYEGGFEHMYHAISDTAEYGAYEAGPRVIDQHVADRMLEILTDIQQGEFARRWIREYEAGMPILTSHHEAERDSDLEDVGRRLRSMMPWLDR